MRIDPNTSPNLRLLMDAAARSAATDITFASRIPMSNDGAGRSLKWWIIGFAIVEAILIATVILLRF